MTDQKKPQTLEDKDLDEAQGGLVINLSVGVKDQDGTRDVWKAPAGIEAGIKDRDGGAFASGASGDPNV